MGFCCIKHRILLLMDFIYATEGYFSTEKFGGRPRKGNVGVQAEISVCIP